MAEHNEQKEEFKAAKHNYETTPLDVMTFLQIRDIDDCTLLKNSHTVLKKKIESNLPCVEEIVLVNAKKVKEFDAEEIGGLLETIMLVCNFTVTHVAELKADLKEGKNPPASIEELANVFAKMAGKHENRLTVKYIVQFIEKLLAEDSSIAVIDLNDELKLYKAERTEILRPQTTATVAKTYTDGFSETLQKSIGMYEGLLEQQRFKGSDTSDTEKMLVTLRSQWSVNTEPVKNVNARAHQKADRRTKALEEVFHFYTKQCAVANSKKTFETVQAEINTMNLGYFLKFAKDFAIPIDLKKIKEMFTKIAEAGRHLYFDRFIGLLEELAFEVNKVRIASMENDKIVIGQKLEKVNQKLLLEEEDADRKTSVRRAKAEKLTNEIRKLTEQMKALKAATASETISEFYKFLGINEVNTYKERLAASVKSHVLSKDRIRAESVEGTLVPSKEHGTGKSIVGLSLASFADIAKNRRKNTIMNDSSKILLPNASCKDFSSLRHGEEPVLSGTLKKFDYRRSECADWDLNKPLRDLQSVRSTVNLKGISHINSGAGRYQNALPGKFGANVLMKSVTLSKKFDKDQLCIEDKVLLLIKLWL